MKMEEQERAVVVTTKDRGVFFGYVTGDVCRARQKLKRGRNCVYWAANTKGFMGLANTGPLEGARVSV
jgi:hypothetical protein